MVLKSLRFGGVETTLEKSVIVKTLKMYLRALGFRGFLKAINGKATNSIVFFRLSEKCCKFPVWLRIPSSDVHAYKQVFLNMEYDFYVERPPKIIVDAGANAGLVSIYFANKYMRAKIISIEPERGNFEVLKKNTAPYSNIIPVQAALWDANQMIDVIDLGLGKWGFVTESESSKRPLTGSICHSVRGMTINRIMENFNLAKIDILKVDIEGAEKEVFCDSSAWIDKVDCLIVELHERMKSGCNRSFYCGTDGFDNEWKQGENVYLSRGNIIKNNSPVR